MLLSRQGLAKIDRHLLSQLDHQEGVQLVKVPVSEAVWSTWRRYCEALGIPMDRALSILLHRELEAIVDTYLERAGTLLGEREARIIASEKALATRASELALREKALDSRERNLAARRKKPPARSLLAPSVKPGRNAPCPCGSGKKFKYCHGRASQVG